MNKKNTIKYAYIKNGDVIQQLQGILPIEEKAINYGPSAFISDFLRMIGHNKVLLLSYGNENANMASENIKAKIYRHELKYFKEISKVILGIIIFIKVVFQLLSYKPNRILCGKTGTMLWACFFVSKIYKIPLVHSRHNQVDHEGLSLKAQIRTSLDNWFIRHIPATICNGPYLRQQLLNIGISPSKIFEFDVVLKDTRSGNQRNVSSIPDYTNSGKNRLILFVGRVQEDKGIFDLFNACAEQLVSDQTLKLLYVGDGIHLAQLQNRIEQRGLTQKVILTGRLPIDVVVGIMKQSKIIITPTRSSFPEGRCNVVLEGLVMGIPVIAPNFGPFPYIIKHGYNGLLYETDSVEDLRRKIMSAIYDNTLNKKLNEGAQKSGDNLLIPKLTYSQATELAFAVS